jgi:cell division cycle 14
MVVGPQQHWLHLNQSTFREWWFEDTMKAKMAEMTPSTPVRSPHKQRYVSNGQTYTPPNGSSRRAALGEIESNERSNVGGNSIGVQEDNLPVPTPGQPRKTSKLYGGGTSVRSPVRARENEPFIKSDYKVEVSRFEGETDEEFHLRQVARRITSSRSPTHKDKERRAISMTTTKSSMTSTTVRYGGESDAENTAPAGARPKTPAGSKSGSGNGGISVGKVRSSPSRRSTDSKGGVRKTSGRVGSVGSSMVRQKPS